MDLTNNVEEVVVEPQTIDEVDNTEVIESDVVDTPTEDVQIDDNTSTEQSHDKSNPANKAFATLRKERKQLQAERDNINRQFAELAKAQGFDKITTADEYFIELNKQQAAAKYKKSNNPVDLIDAITEGVKSSLAPREALAQEVASTAPKAEIDTFNEQYGYELGSFDDIVELPNSEMIFDHMENNNLSLADAYFLANKDSVVKSEAKKARQQAINQAKGFSHVKKDSNAGEVDTVSISPSELSELKRWFPEKSTAELTKLGKSYKKSGHVL